MRELLIEKYEKPTEIDDYGSKWWENKYGQLHRNYDLPAVICFNGDMYWLKNGLNYRGGNRSTIILADGRKYYYKNGKTN